MKQTRREVVLKLRQRQWSAPRIAEKLGVNEITIRRDLNSGSTFVEPELPERSIGKDGKSYPATKTADTPKDAR